ncbi:hypothetical protein HDU93_003756 [Gonapodya sp. JEL0774]|nr:hypothetical protein HDU93_003756 [Gonapodya sp. JEL0774]
MSSSESTILDIPLTTPLNGDAEINVSQSSSLAQSGEDTDTNWMQSHGYQGGKQRCTLRWKDLTYTVTEQTGEEKSILQSVSGVARSGEMIAVMGGSGSGKTTLLNILSGRFAEGNLEGQILFNSKPRDHTMWPWLYGFVEQLDCFFGDLTVGEILDYSAEFKIKNVTRLEKKRRIEEVLQQLGLTTCRDVIVGNPERFTKGISTGQKKRLAIAVSMLNHPEILFLDEPTSGLDSFTALNTVQFLRDITTREEQICMISIHQPRENILALFDKLLILSKGTVIFMGTVPEAHDHFTKMGFPVPDKVNPSDYWLDICTPDLRTPELEEQSNKRIEELSGSWEKSEGKVGLVRMNTKASQHKNVAVTIETSLALGWFAEFLVLLRLSFILLIRDKLLIAVRTSGAIATLLVFSVIYWQLDTAKLAGQTNFFGFVFFYLTGLSFLSMTVPIPVFLENRLTIKRERAAYMYRPTTMFFARLTVWGLFHTLYTILDGLVYWGTIGVQNPAAFMLAGSQISVYFVICALAIGALIPHMGAAVVIASVVMILPSSMFSGSFDAVNKLIPWTKLLDPLQYTMCMIGQGWFGIDFPPPVEVVPGLTIRTNPDACYIKGFWQNFGTGFVFLFLAIVGAIYALHIGTRTKHRLA